MQSGFFPAAVYLLTIWYKRYEVQKRMAVFYTAASLSGAFSGLLAYGIEQMDGVSGLGGWQWYTDRRLLEAGNANVHQDLYPRRFDSCCTQPHRLAAAPRQSRNRQLFDQIGEGVHHKQTGSRDWLRSRPSDELRQAGNAPRHIRV